MKNLKTLLFAVLLFVSGAALARAPVPVIDLLDQPALAASGQALSCEELLQAARGAAEGKKWVVGAAADGRLSASLSWNNNKHTIVVDIACQADRYSITYKDSVNMKYWTGDGQPVIHPYYNRFVGELNEAIRSALGKL